MTKETIEKILDDLTKVDRLIKNYHKTAVLHNIERDIILTKLRSVYDLILLDQPQQQNTESSSEREILIPPSSNVTFSTKEDKASEEKTAKESANIVESGLENAATIASDADQKIKIKSQHTVKTEILAEKFEQKNFLNEALAQYKNMFDIVKKMQNKPLQNIFSAINLNDRFLFINELFNNDDSLYQSTIEKLNAFNTFNDAIQYLDQNFKWDFDDEQVQKLLELVHRRFLPENNEH